MIVTLPHLVRRRSVIHGVEGPLDVRQNLLVTRDVPAWVELRADRDVVHGFVAEDVTDPFEARDHGLGVRGVRQPVGVDEGLVARRGRGDGDGAAGLGRNIDGHEGGVLVAVCDAVLGRVLEVANVVGEGKVFEFGPVRGEGGEICMSKRA